MNRAFRTGVFICSAVLLAAGALAADTQPAAKIPPPFTSPADVYSGISGPGLAVAGNGHGGWTSGQHGVNYDGPNPKPGWTVNPRIWSNQVSDLGLLPALKPIWNVHLRDTIIIIGGDGNYYMTGSTGDNIWDRNDGVELWRSADLQHWDYLGLVWSVERDGAAWQKQWRTVHEHTARDVWAPEIHFIKGNYYIAMCMAGGGGSGILKSVTGKPEGPYKSPLVPDNAIATGIDATLFQDDDGKVYFTNRGAQMVWLMKDDMSGFDGPGHAIQFEPPADGSWTRKSIAEEGASLFKHNGKYYLGGAAHITDKRRYSSVVAISDNIFGPYKQWHEAVPCGGGGDYFQDKKGDWYCTCFGNDALCPWREEPGIVKIDFHADGTIFVAKDQPEFILQKN